MRIFPTVLLLTAAVLPCSSANAMIVIDDPALGSLNPSTATINGAIFTVEPISGGTITEFFSLDLMGMSGGTEVGHNSSADPGNDEVTFSAVQLTDVPIVMESGTSYFQFWLDINETGSGGGNGPITFERFMAFSSPTDGLTFSFAGSDPLDGQLGSLRYATPNPAELTVETSQVGDNQGDLEFLIPVSNFAGANSNDFLYLWARISDVHGGDEEFNFVSAEGQTFLPPNVAVPEPSAFLLLGVIGAVGISWKRFKALFGTL